MGPRLPPPQAIEFGSRVSGRARRPRNWGRARGGSREGERRVRDDKGKSDWFPFLVI